MKVNSTNSHSVDITAITSCDQSLSSTVEDGDVACELCSIPGGKGTHVHACGLCQAILDEEKAVIVNVSVLTA